MTNLDNRIDAAPVRIPKVQPGNSLAHRMVARIARSALGIRIIRKVGPHIDPTLIRLTGGRLSSVIPFPALLLSHTGARSGVMAAAALDDLTRAQLQAGMATRTLVHMDDPLHRVVRASGQSSTGSGACLPSSQ